MGKVKDMMIESEWESIFINDDAEYYDYVNTFEMNDFRQQASGNTATKQDMNKSNVKAPVKSDLVIKYLVMIPERNICVPLVTGKSLLDDPHLMRICHELSVECDVDSIEKHIQLLEQELLIYEEAVKGLHIAQYNQKEHIQSVILEIETLSTNISDATKDLHRCSFFQFAKKRELDDRILKLRSSMEKSNANLHDEQCHLSEMMKREGSYQSNTHVCREWLEKINSLRSVAKFNAEQAESAKAALEKDFQKSEAVLEVNLKAEMNKNHNPSPLSSQKKASLREHRIEQYDESEYSDLMGSIPNGGVGKVAYLNSIEKYRDTDYYGPLDSNKYDSCMQMEDHDDYAQHYPHNDLYYYGGFDLTDNSHDDADE